MTCKKNELYEAYHKLLKLDATLHENENCQCQAEDVTSKQKYYLKVIDKNYRVTFSQLAQETQNSKPTITELISKFISMGCVYRERSPEDGRVYFIYLTPKGKSIARSEERTQIQFIERIKNSLTDDELDQLITLLNKIL
ncbi:MarR family winged helix-turn-helix transcriptional regulator [uncultured Acetobacterium sp.]|jgi:DNA-binding MarR family transcriptional regulator|uniref:MarR family winged helix-turn-helix transcriptional regulator n=1 Tax=uncultured Acetobacterium sp. TaxID=217139 RepID=UPI0025F9FE04|nr:MarR family winged helix-turn-helix transcriptional regulator [uncultured Acetobacterium sp.]